MPSFGHIVNELKSDLSPCLMSGWCFYCQELVRMIEETHYILLRTLRCFSILTASLTIEHMGERDQYTIE